MKTRWMLLASIVLLVVSGISAYLFGFVPWMWQASLGLGVALLLGYLFTQRSFYKESLGKKTTQYGLNSIVMAVLATGVFAMINTIVAQHDLKKDFTKNKLHTLSDQTVKVLQGLKSEVVLKAFVEVNQLQAFDAVLSKYTYLSKLVKREFVDADKDPMLAKQYKIKQEGVIIVESQNRSSRIENVFGPDDPKIEEKITNAIISVSKGEKKKVYFITGHGEKLVSDNGREGFSDVKEALGSSLYQVEELLIVDKEKIPADAEVVVLAGPKSDLMEHELKMLESYVLAGGKLFVMVEPNGTPSLKGFLAKFGADWKVKKTIFETNRLQQLAGGNPLTPVVTTYTPGHQITQEAKQMTIFAIATPIEKAATTPNGYKVESLFSTSPRSLEVEMQGDKVKVNEKTDRKGPISLALAISGKAIVPGAKPEAKTQDKEDKKPGEEEKKEQEFRLLVVGDTDFGSNNLRRFGMNADLFQNMVSWLSKDEDLISIRPKPTNTSEWEITEERFRIINLASIWIMPPMMFIAGLVVWLTRRRK